MKKPIILWKDGSFSMAYGFVNGQCLFDIDGYGGIYSVVFNIADARSKKLKGTFSTVEQAKEAARDVLGKWLSEIEYEEEK